MRASVFASGFSLGLQQNSLIVQRRKGQRELIRILKADDDPASLRRGAVLIENHIAADREIAARSRSANSFGRDPRTRWRRWSRSERLRLLDVEVRRGQSLAYNVCDKTIAG